MTALLRVLALWRGQAMWLGLGLTVSLASIGMGVALLALAGAHVAVLVAGGVVTAGLLLQVAGPIRVVLRYFERLSTHAATFRALADLRVWFFRGISRRSAGGLGMQRSGDLAARIVGDVEALDGLYLRIIVPLAGGLMLLPIIGFIVWAGSDPGLAMGVAGLLAAAVLAIPLAAAQIEARRGVAMAEANAALRVSVVDTLTGLRDVRAFGAERRMLDAMRAHDGAAMRAQAAVAAGATGSQAAGFLCGQAALVLILLAAADRPVFAVGAVFLTVGAFEAASLLPRAGALAGYAAAAARRVLGAAEARIAVAEPGVAAVMPMANALRFDGVNFGWQMDRPVFEGLTLDIPQGARVAILGPSGSGKSTIAALLLKVVAPVQGRIMLGGTDIAALDSTAARARFGWLAQATHLFDDTIRNNLQLGRADGDEKAIWRALDDAEIGDFVRALPDQLDTWIGEGGSRLSGGQGRRIALARTLLSQAPVLILDEPSAGLDAETERAFLQTLNAVPAGRTVILIAHRLTGVERLDRIWRLSGGHAVAAAA